MMRALGYADCMPYGDTSGLQSLLCLETRPDVDATRRLMAVFAPCHRVIGVDGSLWVSHSAKRLRKSFCDTKVLQLRTSFRFTTNRLSFA